VGPRRQRRHKKKKRERERWAGAGRLDGPAGLAGPKGKQARFCFFFPFTNFFFKPFSFSISNQTLSNFFSKIYKLLETTQATKNHASQLMMHIHLLSLSYLNYI
jgi:hypothetical protein